MIRSLSMLLSAAVFALSATPSPAADIAQRAERLNVGKTNIFCVQPPCPWRGIYPAGTQPATPSGLLWREEALPRLVASSADADRIVKAWDTDACLEIAGTLIGSTLHVEHIVGTCR